MRTEAGARWTLTSCGHLPFNSRHRVLKGALEADTGKLRSVGRPRLFGTSAVVVQPRLFGLDALRRAEVRLSRAEAELLARSLRWALRRDLAAAHGRGEEGPSPITLRTVEAAAAALEGATLLEAAKRSEAAWTGDPERDWPECRRG